MVDNRQVNGVVRRITACVAAICLAQTLIVAQSHAEQEKQREQWQRVTDIFQAMGVRPGARVADVGAGDGFFTSRLAAAVEPGGQVYAVDVADTALDRLRRRLKDDALSNVSVIKGTSTDPQLPPATLDAALIINAYHEMPEHQAMLAGIRTALKPNGRLVIVEPIAEARRAANRADQTREHEIGPEFVLQDARAAGLRVIGLEDPFTTRGRAIEWMMTLTPNAGTTTASAAPSTGRTEPIEPDWKSPNLRMSLEEFVKLAASGDITIIDVRDEGMFATGHIPNAILIPLESVETSTNRLKAHKRPLVTYCS
jgi:predicted methyltransferase